MPGIEVSAICCCCSQRVQVMVLGPVNVNHLAPVAKKKLFMRGWTLDTAGHWFCPDHAQEVIG